MMYESILTLLPSSTQACSAIRGEGLAEGLDWITQNVKQD